MLKLKRLELAKVFLDEMTDLSNCTKEEADNIKDTELQDLGTSLWKNELNINIDKNAEEV